MLGPNLDQPKRLSDPLKLFLIAAPITIIVLVIYGYIIERVKQMVPGDILRFLELLGHTLVTLSVVFLVHLVEQRSNLRSIQGVVREMLEDFFPLWRTSEVLGLKSIYKSRRDSQEAVIDAIKGASRHVYLLGVAFTEAVLLAEILPTLATKLKDSESKTEKEKFKLRILSLNPITSPSVFRAFLESSPETPSAYVKHHESLIHAKLPLGAAYHEGTLFSECSHTFRNLDNDTFGKLVRFYRRDPGIWMVIADDTIFVESYTFGRSADQTGGNFNHRLGGHMPVLEFNGVNDGVSGILWDHFDRLWKTSTDDILHMGAQLEDKLEVLSERVFDVRLPWLKNVAELLKREDRRLYPRQGYDADLAMNAFGLTYSTKLIDCSQTGVRVLLAETDLAEAEKPPLGAGVEADRAKNPQLSSILSTAQKPGALGATWPHHVSLSISPQHPTVRGMYLNMKLFSVLKYKIVRAELHNSSWEIALESES